MIRELSVKKPYNFLEELYEYLEGNTVSKEWVNFILSLTDKGPATLYRLAFLPKKTKVKKGDKVKVKNGLVSASDKQETALWAGCSYHHDVGTSLKGKIAVLLEIHNPHICMSFETIKKYVDKNARGGHVLRRTLKEREFLIGGGSQGLVIAWTDDMFVIKEFQMLTMKNLLLNFRPA